MIEKPAITEQKLDKTISERWSGRAFDAHTPVSDDMLMALCEAAQWAPSCFGDQPWRFIVWNKQHNKVRWQQAVDCLSPGNQEWAKQAPIILLATSVNSFSHNGKNNRWVGYDTGAASLNLCLQATFLGLMSHQMGGFDADKLRIQFNIPDDIHCWSMISVGHPAPLDSLNEQQLERELKARERRPISDLFFNDQWSSPLTSGE